MKKALEAARKLVKILEEQVEGEKKVELATLNPGEVFKIGEHDFVVLKQQQDQTKVIAKAFMVTEQQIDKDTKDYDKSSLKKFIETNIQPMIEAAVGAENLVEHEVDLTSVDMQQEFEPCKCKVRPVTFDEAREFNDLLVNEELPGYYWTCTPWSTEKRGWKYSMAVVSPSGRINNRSCDDDYGVRPFCILKSNIFVSRGE